MCLTVHVLERFTRKTTAKMIVTVAKSWDLALFNSGG